MEAGATVQLKKGGKVVQNSTIGHYWEWHHDWEGTFGDILELLHNLGKYIASKFGYGSGDFNAVTQKLEDIFSGGDIKFYGKAAVAVTGGQDFDEIEILLEAWSEDDLKGETCKVAMQPPEAQYRGEDLGATNYKVRFIINTANLKNGVYTFLWGGQDNGWSEDVAFVGQLEIVYDRGPLLALSNLPPLWNKVPDVPVADQIAHDYASLNTLIAEFGIDLGDKNKNSLSHDLHYKWALNQKLPVIVEQTAYKVQALARQVNMFPYAYAILSSELTKIRGDRPSDNEALLHIQYANKHIAAENTVSNVRDELLRKIARDFSRPVVRTITAVLDWPNFTAVQLQQAKAEIATRASAWGLKRSELRPQKQVQNLQVQNLIGEFSSVRELQIGDEVMHIPEHRIRRNMGG